MTLIVSAWLLNSKSTQKQQLPYLGKFFMSLIPHDILKFDQAHFNTCSV